MSQEPANVLPQAAIRRSPWRSLWIAFRVLSAIVIGVLITRVTIDWPAFAQQVPPEIQQAAADHPEQVGTAYVRILLGSFIDRHELWRVEVGPDVIRALVSNCQLRKLASADEMPRAFWRQWPYWWRPPPSGPAKYYISPHFDPDTRGRDGQHYLMAYDEPSRVLYVWHKNNF